MMRRIGSIEELQEIELEIMRHIHYFCEENGLRYCLTYGSLLGAIRHGGFIPWDDDFDIWMIRDDYEKFCKSFDDYGSEFHLKVVNATTSPCYKRAMGKVINLDTVFTEDLFEGDDPIGVFVDIWPLDALPNNLIIRKIHIIKMKVYQKLLFGIIKKNEHLTPLKRIVHSILKNIEPLKIVYKEEKLLKKYSINSAREMTWYTDFNNSTMPVDMLESLSLHKFEQYEFYIPNDYKRLLTIFYKDYMRLPPENKRIPRHPSEAYWK